MIVTACESCGDDFQEQDKQYTLEEVVKKRLSNKLVTVCYLCAAEMIKEALETLGVNLWTRSFLDLYQLLFPGEISSFYVHAMQKALTELYLQNWDEKPDLSRVPLFRM